MSSSLWTWIIYMDFVVLGVNWLLHEGLVQSLASNGDVVRKLNEVIVKLPMNRLIIVSVLFIVGGDHFFFCPLFFTRTTLLQSRNERNWVDFRNFKAIGKNAQIDGLLSWNLGTEFRRERRRRSDFRSEWSIASQFFNLLISEVLIRVFWQKSRGIFGSVQHQDVIYSWDVIGFHDAID